MGKRENPTTIRDAARLRRSLEHLMRVLHRNDRLRAASHGLSVSQCHALLGLLQTGPMSVTDLGDHLHLEKSTASRLAKGLSQKGLVRTRAPSTDGRVLILQLTEAGQRRARRILNELSEEYRILLEEIEIEFQSELPRLLERVARHLMTDSSSLPPMG